MSAKVKSRTASPSPVCPSCTGKGIEARMWPQGGAHKWRCPSCKLAFLAPVPEELPEPGICPECRKNSRIQQLIRLDWGWLWCSVCNMSIQELSGAQHAAQEMATRRAVGGCYGDPTLHHAKRHGGGGAKGRRRTGKKTGGGGRTISLTAYVRQPPGKR